MTNDSPSQSNRFIVNFTVYLSKVGKAISISIFTSNAIDFTFSFDTIKYHLTLNAFICLHIECSPHNACIHFYRWLHIMTV